jgi:hypothetical protein
MTAERAVMARLGVGRKRYGHGVRVRDDTREWGTKENSWIEMALEEFIDGAIYVVADFIRDNGTAGSMNPEDDNDLILFYIRHPELVDSLKHRRMLDSLLKIIREYSASPEPCG